LFSNKRYTGLFLALSSGLGFMASNTLAGLSYQFGTNPLAVSTTRFILPAIILLLLLKIDGRLQALPKRIALISFVLGIITVIYTIALLSAIELLPLAIAILIFYLFPIFTGLALAVLGWQKITLTMAVSSLIAFLGIALALGVEFTKLDLWGMIYATIAATGLATVSVISNRLMVNEDARLVTLYMCFSTTLILIVMCLFSGGISLPKTNSGWTIIITSHAFYAYAMISFYISISLIGAGETTFYNNIEPIMAVGAGFLLLGQTLVTMQYVGIFVVVFALLFNERRRIVNVQPQRLD
jgi:drug/metabolite transporter (DMT)-like permease